MTPTVTCIIDGCEMPRRSRGWCIKHYTRWRTHGNPTTVKGAGRPPRRHGIMTIPLSTVAPSKRAMAEGGHNRFARKLAALILEES